MPVTFPPEYPPSRLLVFDDKWEPLFLQQEQTLTKTLAPFLETNDITLKENYWEKIKEHNGWNW